MTIQQEVRELLTHFDIPPANFTGGQLAVTSPITGERIANVAVEAEPERTIAEAHKAFLTWRDVPAPRRGELGAEPGAAVTESGSAEIELYRAIEGVWKSARTIQLPGDGPVSIAWLR